VQSGRGGCSEPDLWDEMEVVALYDQLRGAEVLGLVLEVTLADLTQDLLAGPHDGAIRRDPDENDDWSAVIVPSGYDESGVNGEVLVYDETELSGKGHESVESSGSHSLV
jgi:hypothetical protein